MCFPPQLPSLLPMGGRVNHRLGEASLPVPPIAMGPVLQLAALAPKERWEGGQRAALAPERWEGGWCAAPAQEGGQLQSPQLQNMERWTACSVSLPSWNTRGAGAGGLEPHAGSSHGRGGTTAGCLGRHSLPPAYATNCPCSCPNAGAR